MGRLKLSSARATGLCRWFLCGRGDWMRLRCYCPRPAAAAGEQCAVDVAALVRRKYSLALLMYGEGEHDRRCLVSPARRSRRIT